ncbi:MAG TPA: FMN-binding glutamate synthase family protein [Aeromicrobium sp.]|nr:FMN-binding glutamate synthase family protein [Aeromicrobium sp.]
MVRWFVIAGILALGAALGALAVLVDSGWWWAASPVLIVGLVGAHDLLQRKHSILRNYPVLGHGRFLAEFLRPEIQQYFVESNTDGAPFDREIRDIVYARAKGDTEAEPFGTQRDVDRIGYEFVTHSLTAKRAPGDIPKVRLGGPRCTQPYDIALLNVSAMSFGSLSGNAIEALNAGAAMGDFAHDTGEGAISSYHRRPGGDLIWELGSAYFGCRTHDGRFDPEKFAERARSDQVKAISIKLSQGAKPGLGGLLPGEKVNAEVAEARGVQIGETIVSPPAHDAFSTPRELVQFVEHLRELSAGKPVGIKLCIGSRHEFLGICKAMVDEDAGPDFVIVDGSEGGTGAGPVEFEDHVGTPLTEGLIFVHNALTGAGLRHRVKVGASGKVATGIDIVKRICQGADFTMSARAMMFALGCIQAQACHTNRCPVGVATQDPWRARALRVDDKSVRVRNYQAQTVASAKQIVASMGLDSFDDLHPGLLHRRLDHHVTVTYADLYDWLEPRELYDATPDAWRQDWELADSDSFGRRSVSRPKGFRVPVSRG